MFYELDFDKIQTLEDVKDVLRSMHVTFTRNGHEDIARLFKPQVAPDEGTDAPSTHGPGDTWPVGPGPSSEQANQPNADKRTADFEKIEGYCSTFEGNFDLIGDDAMANPMTLQDAVSRGEILLSQIRQVAVQHVGEEGFQEIWNQLSMIIGRPLARDSVKEIHSIAAARVAHPGAVAVGGTDLEGQGDMTGKVG